LYFIYLTIYYAFTKPSIPICSQELGRELYKKPLTTSKSRHGTQPQKKSLLERARKARMQMKLTGRRNQRNIGANPQCGNQRQEVRRLSLMLAKIATGTFSPAYPNWPHRVSPTRRKKKFKGKQEKKMQRSNPVFKCRIIRTQNKHLEPKGRSYSPAIKIHGQPN
jgi:hypothetical protein